MQAVMANVQSVSVVASIVLDRMAAAAAVALSLATGTWLITLLIL